MHDGEPTSARICGVSRKGDFGWGDLVGTNGIILRRMTMALKKRCPDDLVQELIDNEGLRRHWGEVSPMGVLRLALDLMDARQECKRLARATTPDRCID